MINENVQKRKSINIGIIIIIVIITLVVGIGIGWLLFNNPKEKDNNNNNNNNSEDNTKKQEVEKIDDSSVIISDAMESYIELFGSVTNSSEIENMISSPKSRYKYIGMELDPYRNTTTGTAQSVGYVDYDTFKKKYEEIFGDNYNLDDDLNEIDDDEYCNSYPGIENQNQLCWAINYGVSAGTWETNITNKAQEDDSYIVDGNLKVTLPNGEEKIWTIKIIYSIKNNKTYLKSISLKK